MGRVWSLQDAKNRFSAVVDAALKGEPQRVTKRRQDAVVIVSVEEFERLLALDRKPTKTFTQHIIDFPKLPEGMDEFLDFDARPKLGIRDLDFGIEPAEHS